jgi:glycosyltransferase involved in cell wall biosynthesis
VIENEQPLVSIVIPCLNRAQYLEPTIQSVLKQDYPNIECIVIDGGSTDGTLEILNRYNGKLDWISEPDKGHSDAINKGWKRSHGSILTWLNADDLWAVPNAVTQAVAFFKANPDVDVVYGKCETINSKGDIVGMNYLREWELRYAVEYCDHCIPQPAAFIRRDVLEKVGWLELDFNYKKDHELWLRIGLVGKFKYFPVVLAQARNIKGISYLGDKSAATCVKITEKFFTLPNIPVDLIPRKRRAMSNSYLRGISYLYVGGHHWAMMVKYFINAVKYDPSNTLHILKYVMMMPVGEWLGWISTQRKQRAFKK